MKKLLSLVLCALLFISAVPVIASAEETSPERRMTPIMGWSSWNFYATNINDEIIRSQMDAIVSTGLSAKGYTYVNIDDGWQNGRDDGVVNCKTQRFPNGMKSLADYAHSLGLKAGMYTDAGETTCGWYDDEYTTDPKVGLYGHDDEDLNMYFTEWGYDFIKVDWCGGSALELDVKDRYTTIGRKINEIEKKLGKDLIYNICCWNFPGDWATETADSWRIHGDISPDFESILLQIDDAEKVASYCGPGHYNDLDMLQVGNGMTYDEDKSHFSMWCMMSSPLLIGTDLTSLSDDTYSILSNEEIIALDQDQACISAKSVYTANDCQMWVKPLGSSDSRVKAIAVLNRSDERRDFTIDWSKAGFAGSPSVRDLWLHQDIPVSGDLTVSIPAHGIVVYKVTGEPVFGDSSFTLVDSFSYNGAESVDLTAEGSSDWLYPAISEHKTGYNRIAEISRGDSVKAEGGVTSTWSNGYDSVSGSSSDTLMIKGSYSLSVKVSGARKKADLILTGSGKAVISAVYGDKTLTDTVTLGKTGTYVYSLIFSGESAKSMTVSVTPEDGSDIFIQAVCLNDYSDQSSGKASYLLFDAQDTVNVSGEDNYILYGAENPFYGDPTASNAAICGASSGNAGSLIWDGTSVNESGLTASEIGSSLTVSFAPISANTVYDLYFTVSGVSASVIPRSGESIDVSGCEVQHKRLRVCVKDGGCSAVSLRLNSIICEGGYIRLDACVQSLSPFVESGISYGSGKMTFDASVINAGDGELYIALYSVDGKFISAQKADLSSGVFDIGVPEGFVGIARTYFWHNGKALAPSSMTICNSSNPTSDWQGLIGPVKAHRLVDEGAVLIDVRGKEEYDAGHIDGAVNIPHTGILSEAASVIPDISTPVITYCSSSKRSRQAAQTLLEMGYKNVYILGTMNNWNADIYINFSKDNTGLLFEGNTVRLDWPEYSGDDAEPYISVGENSSLADAVPLSSFTVTSQKSGDITLKAYLVSGGRSYAEAQATYLFFNDDLIDVYASDLTWTENIAGWGSTRRDASIEGKALTVGGMTFSKGIGTHATSTISMEIPEGMTRFIALVGHDAEVLGGTDFAKIRFTVAIDGKTVFDTGIMQISETAFVNVSIEGAGVITLTADETNDNNYFDHADWAIAGFYK